MKIYVCTNTDVYTHSSQKDIVSIGRAETNDFQVPVPELSKEHCKLLLHGDKLYIVDLGSKNGVYVDGHKIPAHQKLAIMTNSKIKLSKKCVLSFDRPVMATENDTVVTKDIRLDLPPGKE